MLESSGSNKTLVSAVRLKYDLDKKVNKSKPKFNMSPIRQ